jgi:DNA-directed RNA polymerase subunit RPC12/RpoP
MRMVRKCGQCGGSLRRVHRTFWERFRYLAIYECKGCEREVLIPRRYTYHFGDVCRCPKCGTYRIVKLKSPDKIDPMWGGLLNLLERLAGGNLHHCCYCRVQFFDRRPMDPNTTRVAARPEMGPPPPETREEIEQDDRLENTEELYPGIVRGKVASPRNQARSDE